MEDFSARQHEFLERLTNSFCERTRKSKQNAQKYKNILADNLTPAGFRFSTKEMLYPIVAHHSLGSKVWDVDNNEYIDFAMGFGVNLFGHSPDFITDSIKLQLEKGIQLGYQSDLVFEVARLICELTDMERVTFCNSGTEAVLIAIRLARTATHKPKIALFSGSYHGSLDTVLARKQISSSHSIPMAPGITQGAVDDTLVLDYGNPESLDIIRKHKHELAAVLVEPVQSRRPDLQPKAFLQELRRITQEFGIALIFDEIITGFRIHQGGAQAWFDVHADIATYGKIIGGGMPIGAVAGKAIYMNGIDGGPWNYGDATYPQAETTYYAGTFSKHPLAMASSLAILKKIKDLGPSLQQNLNQRTSDIVTKLNDFFVNDHLPISLVHFGSLFRFSFSRNMDILFYLLLQKGVYLSESRNCFLSTAHSDKDINDFIDVVKTCIGEMREVGFLSEQTQNKSLDELRHSLNKSRLDDSPGKDPFSEQIPSKNIPPELILKENLTSFPSTDAQQQLWFLSQLDINTSIAYNQSLIMEISGNLNSDAVYAAIQTLIERHETLRTAFSDDGKLQVILPKAYIEIPITDLSHFGENELEKAKAEWLLRESNYFFNLTKAPILRAHILKINDQKHLLVLLTHHIILDGWSMNILLGELADLYSSFLKNEPPNLEPVVQFHEYAQWLGEQIKSPRMEEAERYWLSQLKEPLPEINLPTDHPYPPIKTFTGARCHFSLSEVLSQKLRVMSAKYGATQFMTFLTAFEIFLHKLTQQDDIILQIPMSGRINAPFGGSMLGYSINMVPLRSRIGIETTFLEHLDNVKIVLSGAYEYGNYPFTTLIEKIKTQKRP